MHLAANLWVIGAPSQTKSLARRMSLAKTIC